MKNRRILSITSMKDMSMVTSNVVAAITSITINATIEEKQVLRNLQNITTSTMRLSANASKKT